MTAPVTARATTRPVPPAAPAREPHGDPTLGVERVPMPPATAAAAAIDPDAAGGRRAPRWPRGPRKDRSMLRMTDAEWETFQQRVRATGRTTGRYLRELALGSVPRVRQTQANAEVIRHLSAIGNNLNQLARNANADRMPVEAAITAALDEVLATIRRLG